MKLVSYRHDGRETFGAVVEGGIVELKGKLDPSYETIKDMLLPEALAQAAKFASSRPDAALDAIQYLPPVPNPGKIICIGLNYKTHVDEAKRDLPPYPMVFFRTVKSHVAHGEAIIRPRISEQFDFEGEVAVIIGRPGRQISRDRALDHVAGYSCYNDGSVRDWQRQTSQWGPGKNFERSGGFGPWMLTSDEVPDPSTMVLMTRLNGEEVQHASVGDLIFDVPALIEYCSSFMTLETGDVLVTGTTGGVGGARTPPLWMKAGDVLEVEVSPVGVLRTVVEDETV